MDSEKYMEELKKLEEVIWETRKSRINAECRLLAINRFVQHMYNLFLEFVDFNSLKIKRSVAW